MLTVSTSETSVNFHDTARINIPEGFHDQHICLTRSSNLQVHENIIFLTPPIMHTKLIFFFGLERLSMFSDALFGVMNLIRHWVILLWMRDQQVQRPLPTKDNTRDKHPCRQRDSNPRSQQPSGQVLRLGRPLGSVKYYIYYSKKCKLSLAII
jgi:hypothetical protein